jgi:hypothetical protein
LLRDHQRIAHAVRVGGNFHGHSHHQRDRNTQPQRDEQARHHGGQHDLANARPRAELQGACDLQQARFDLTRCGLGQDQQGPETRKGDHADLHPKAKAEDQHRQGDQGHRGNGPQHLDAQKAHGRRPARQAEQYPQPQAQPTADQQAGAGAAQREQARAQQAVFAGRAQGAYECRKGLRRRCDRVTAGCQRAGGPFEQRQQEHRKHPRPQAAQQACAGAHA